MNEYHDIYNPEHPNSRKNGSVMLHVVKASEMLNRPLMKDEVVHHKDFNKANNEYENLMVFRSESDHIRYHRYLESKNKDEYTVVCIDGVWSCSKAENRCGVCGKIGISPYAKICKDCLSKKWKTAVISKETLAELICKKNIVEIGKMFGVTDNAIRKALKKHGLPYKRNEIRKFAESR